MHIWSAPTASGLISSSFNAQTGRRVANQAKESCVRSQTPALQMHK